MQVLGLRTGQVIDLADVRLRIGEQRGDHSCQLPALPLFHKAGDPWYLRSFSLVFRHQSLKGCVDPLI